MIHETDLKRNGVDNNIKIERKLRRQEGLNTFEMMLQLTNEIKKLGGISIELRKFLAIKAFKKTNEK